MKAILFDKFGDPDVLYLADAPLPSCGPEEVQIAVTATAVNRADLLQRRGLYPPPKGASSILGLEAAGVVVKLGSRAQHQGIAVGQHVMALLSGGGYAEQVIVPIGQVMPIPTGISDVEAAAIPEAYLTAYLNLFLLGKLFWNYSEQQPSILIHGGASGVGTAAISLCRENGFRILCTVGSEERADRCKQLGAHFTWNYRHGDFAKPVLAFTGNRGVDLVFDCIGGSYLNQNLEALTDDGRLVCIGLHGGERGTVDLGLMLTRRLQLIGSTLRGLPPTRKTALVQSFCQRVLPWFEQGRLKPIIDRIYPLREAARAHQALDESHVGKIVLTIADS